jgi:tetratricopeptide (TPR) repeat protein
MGQSAFRGQCLRRLGALAQEREDWPEAIRLFVQVVELEPEDPAARFGLAVSYERGGRFASSVAEFKAILEKTPDQAEILNYLGYMYAEKGWSLDEAESLIRGALKREPLSGAYWDSLGWVHFQKGEHALALQELERALALLLQAGEDDPVVREHLGDTRAKMGDLKAAQKDWRAAWKLDPGNERLKVKIQTQGLRPEP